MQRCLASCSYRCTCSTTDHSLREVLCIVCIRAHCQRLICVLASDSAISLAWIFSVPRHDESTAQWPPRQLLLLCPSPSPLPSMGWVVETHRVVDGDAAAEAAREPARVLEQAPAHPFLRDLESFASSRRLVRRACLVVRSL